jgi:septum formation protein
MPWIMAIHEHQPLLLASRSPRRRALLEQVGIPILVRPVQVDESVRSMEGPDDYLIRVVADKLAAASAVSHEAPTDGCAAILVADTAVVVDDAILGKPSSDLDAREMIAELSGREHRVMTRFAIRSLMESQVEHAETVSTRVWFRRLGEAEIDHYVATGEGVDKAGAYAIQGIGAMLVSGITGDYANVVGLPIGAVVVALQQLGLVGPVPVVTPKGG